MEEEREDVVEGWGSLHPGCCVWVGVPYIHYYLLLLIRFAAPWRKCNATGAEYDDDGVDVGDVDGDDGGVIYYYYCDYYSQSALDCFLNSTIIDHRDTGTKSREKKLHSGKAKPSRGPRGRRGACGSCNR